MEKLKNITTLRFVTANKSLSFIMNYDALVFDLDLRATHITLALIDGIPLGIVKENLGHSKLSTTYDYFSSSGVQMRGQTDGLQIEVPAGKDAKVTALRAAK